jgi:hypothetical protein
MSQDARSYQRAVVVVFSLATVLCLYLDLQGWSSFAFFLVAAFAADAADRAGKAVRAPRLG